MKKTIFISIIFLVTLGGCNYLDDYSQSLVVVKTVSDLDEVLLGDVYMSSKNGVKQLAYGDVGWWLQILDDDINTVAYDNSSSDADFVDDSYSNPLNYNYFGYTTWQMEVGRSYDGKQLNSDDGLWNDFYHRINICNIILSEIEELEITSDDDRAAALRIRGEARFMRAYYYFLLANIYADAYDPDKAESMLGIPVKLTDYIEHDKDKETQFERASLSEVYAQIVEDLETSISYFDQSPQTHSFYRTSGKAAMLLLSRVYLYMQKWDEARLMADKLLTEGVSLWSYAGDLNEGEALISRNNPEILFSEGSLNVQNFMRAKIGEFCISQDLYSLYDDTDYRKTKYFVLNENTDSIALGSKYERGSTIQSYVSDLYLLRSSEAYLNMAEACAMEGDTYTGEALKWLNRFRHYRIANYQDETYDRSTLIDEIRTERRKEFCLEGQRWFDLRRYAVNKEFPYNRTIERMYAVFNDGGNEMLHNEMYRLEEHDKAYTFAIPKSVLNFDRGMPDNVRPAREPIAISNPTNPDEDE